MKIKDLKLILNQYNDDDVVHVELDMGTIHRINRGMIKPATHDYDSYKVTESEHDMINHSLILKVR